MAKILEFKRVKKEIENLKEIDVETDDIQEYISSIMNNYSLTVANRHWILENLLMDINDKLDEYKRELEIAESKLNTVVNAAEQEISAAYSEFNAHVGGMTRAVKQLTGLSPRQSIPKPAAGIAAVKAELLPAP